MNVDYIDHAKLQMRVRGATEEEVVDVLRTGVITPGRGGRLVSVKVLTAGYHWQGRHYPHKEVQIVYSQWEGTTTVITVKTRYGMWEGAL